MTTRAQLESERAALAYVADLVPADCESAVRASIARVDALLSLNDEQADGLAELFCDQASICDAVDYAERADALCTVADLIRREPRGDV